MAETFKAVRVRPGGERWIAKHGKSAKGGRPRMADRRAMSGILYRLRTACQWDAIPAEFGSRSTCYRRLVEWTQEGVFRMMHLEMLLVSVDDATSRLMELRFGPMNEAAQSLCRVGTRGRRRTSRPWGATKPASRSGAPATLAHGAD